MVCLSHMFSPMHLIIRGLVSFMRTAGTWGGFQWWKLFEERSNPTLTHTNMIYFCRRGTYFKLAIFKISVELKVLWMSVHYSDLGILKTFRLRLVKNNRSIIVLFRILFILLCSDNFRLLTTKRWKTVGNIGSYCLHYYILPRCVD